MRSFKPIPLIDWLLCVQAVQKAAGSSKMVDFRASLTAKAWPELEALKADVTTLCRKYPCVGFQADAMKYKL